MHGAGGGVAPLLPGSDLARKRRRVGHAPVQTLATEHTELDLGDSEPTAMFGRVMNLQLVGQPLGFGWREGVVERAGRVDVESVQHQHDTLGVRVAYIDQLVDLLRHGLLTASFIPPRPVRDLRELTRYRTTLVRERAQEVLRVQKLLEGANLKLAAVATDVLGRSGRAMLEALVGGEQDPDALAE
jgi:hypothetical protein